MINPKSMFNREEKEDVGWGGRGGEEETPNWKLGSELELRPEFETFCFANSKLDLDEFET